MFDPLVSHHFSAVMPLLFSSLITLVHLSQVMQSKPSLFILSPLQWLLRNPLLALIHACEKTGRGLSGSPIAYCPRRNVSSLSPLPLGKNMCWTPAHQRLPGQLLGRTDKREKSLLLALTQVTRPGQRSNLLDVVPNSRQCSSAQFDTGVKSCRSSDTHGKLCATEVWKYRKELLGPDSLGCSQTLEWTVSSLLKPMPTPHPP